MDNSARSIFENFLTKEPLFVNKQLLQSNYYPETILHRQDQISQIANILAPALHMNKPSNLFIYGKTGTGKTLSVRYTTSSMYEVAQKENIKLKIIYINCKFKKVADTEYRLMAQLARECGRTIPPTGLPTDEVYKMFFEAIEKENHIIVIVLDEIDQLVKKAGDELLYNLTRINGELKESQISIVGISNDLVFTDSLDPRVKSSLSEEEIVFPPYNALQIQDILNQRAEKAFKPGVIGSGVIEKCSAYAAREHGDARRALELMRVAGELAERENLQKIHINHIDQAEEKIERDRILDIVTTQPQQYQVTLYSILYVCEQATNRKNTASTGEIYDYYKKLSYSLGFRPLTQRRVSDIISELDMLGIINSRVISKGRYGRSREISLAIHETITNKIKAILVNELHLE